MLSVISSFGVQRNVTFYNQKCDVPPNERNARFAVGAKIKRPKAEEFPHRGPTDLFVVMD